MKKSFLVFWDFENVPLIDQVTAKRFVMRLHYLGDVKKSVAFADWNNFPRYAAETLHSENILLIHVPDRTPQSADRVMSNYILDELETNSENHTFIVISGDSDLWPIVDRIKRKKSQVWVIANSVNTSHKMLDAGHEYFDIHTFAAWSGPYARGGTVEPEVLRTAAIVTVHEAIEKIEKEGNKPRTGFLKAVTKRLDPLFSERALGFKNWGEFMKWGKTESGIIAEGFGDASIVKKPKEVAKRFIDLRNNRDEAFQKLFRTVEEMLERNNQMGLIYRPESEEIPIMDDLIVDLRRKGVDHLACGYRSVAYLVQAAHVRQIIALYPTDWRNNEFVLAPWYSMNQLTSWVNDLPEEALGGADRLTDANSLWNIKIRLHRHILKGTKELLANSTIRNQYDSIMAVNDDLVLPLYLRISVFEMLKNGLSCDEIVVSLTKYHSSEIGRDELGCP